MARRGRKTVTVNEPRPLGQKKNDRAVLAVVLGAILAGIILLVAGLFIMSRTGKL